MGNNNNQRYFIRLLKYSRPYKKKLTLSFLFLFIGTFASLYSPVLMKIFIDDHVMTADWNRQAIVMLATGFAGLYLLHALVTWLQTILFQQVAQQVVYDIREQLFCHLFRLPMAFFDREPVGKLVSRVTNDTEIIH